MKLLSFNKAVSSWQRAIARLVGVQLIIFLNLPAWKWACLSRFPTDNLDSLFLNTIAQSSDKRGWSQLLVLSFVLPALVNWLCFSDSYIRVTGRVQNYLSMMIDFTCILTVFGTFKKKIKKNKRSRILTIAAKHVSS